MACLAAFRDRGKQGRFGPGRGVLRKALDEIGHIGRRPVELIGHPQQFRLDRHQAGPVLALLLELIDMLDTGDELLAFDHAIDLLQLGKKSGQQNLIFLPVPPGQRE